MRLQVTELQWHHNERDGVSNHRRIYCLLNRLLRRRSKKHQSSESLAFVRGIHRWPVNSPHKGQVTWKILPFDDVIMQSIQHYTLCHLTGVPCYSPNIPGFLDCLCGKLERYFYRICIEMLVKYIGINLTVIYVVMWVHISPVIDIKVLIIRINSNLVFVNHVLDTTALKSRISLSYRYEYVYTYIYIHVHTYKYIYICTSQRV